MSVREPKGTETRARPRRSRKPRKPASPARASKAKSRRGVRWLALLAVLGLALAGAATSLAGWAAASGPGTGKRVLFEVQSGASRIEVAQSLAAAGVLESPRLFALYAGLLRRSAEFQPGPHFLRDDLSAQKLVDRLARVSARARARVVIPEGFNFRDIGRRLEEREICPADAFGRAVFDPELLRELAIKGPSAEGYLFPASYELLVDSDPKAIVRKLVAETRKRLGQLRERHPSGVARLSRTFGFGEHEILTLASIVEKEAARDEHALVASVFFNRLSDPQFRPARMLQSDPTAAYGCLVTLQTPPSCRNYAGKVTPEMLRDPANPYNTYRHPGLPPGPIANPGERAIRAVLEPAQTDYLYFVAKAGRHVFSRSFAEHRAAIESP